MDLYGDGHKIVTDADHIPGRNYLSGTAPVSVQGQNIVGQAITTYTLTDKSLSNQVVTFNMAVTSDTTSGRVFVGSSPNWQVYTYYDVQKGINKIQFTTELNSDVDGIKITLDNSTANLVIKDVTLNKGNFAREYSPAPEDYAMKSDQVLTTKNLIQALFSDELVNYVDDSFDMNNASPGIYRSWGKKPINAPDNALPWAKYFVIPFIEGNSNAMFQVVIDINGNIFTRAKGGDPAVWIAWHGANLG